MYTFTDQALYDALKELAIISDQVLVDAFIESQEKKQTLAEIIEHRNIMADENLGKVIADLIKLPFAKLTEKTISQEVLRTIPEEFARQHQLIAFEQTPSQLKVASVDPSNLVALDYISRKTPFQIELFYTTRQEVNNTLLLYKRDLGEVFAEIIQANVEQAKGGAEIEPPVIKMVDTIIFYAYQKKASDIHIEPTEKACLVRFRIDGILHDIVKLPKELHGRLVTRIKVMSKLRTDEHQAAQDGKISFNTTTADIDGSAASQDLNTNQEILALRSSLASANDTQTREEKIDIRVSIVPSTDGEKIVMRLLSEQSRKLSLEDLGLRAGDLEKLKKAYQKPHGMLLSTGPTGCGKTTTLYAILKILNTRNVNISTIEDPVEYTIEGITQIQVNPKTNLTFAQGLRSIVRQDPNIILVGEIRDNETADIAVNAAMTGHLVLSTLHTNDAATTIPRLIDMNIEPFLIASTINIIVAQRLVRKVHMGCRVSEERKRSELVELFGEATVAKHFEYDEVIRTYKGNGCPVCQHTGYEGRVGAYEILVIDDDIRQAIVDRKDANEIRKIAVKNGMSTIVDDGLNKVKEGITTIEEVMRVIQEQ